MFVLPVCLGFYLKKMLDNKDNLHILLIYHKGGHSFRLTLYMLLAFFDVYNIGFAQNLEFFLFSYNRILVIDQLHLEVYTKKYTP